MQQQEPHIPHSPLPIDLATLRDQSHMSMGQLAERLSALDPEGNWSTTKVSRYLNDPEAMPASAYFLMSRVLGEEHLTIPAPQIGGADAGTPYAELSQLTDRLAAEAEEHIDVFGPEGAATVERVLTALPGRPLIQVHGAFDAGKTTIINTLLGERYLPTSFQPQTYFVTYLRHVDERPPELGDSDVYIVDGEFVHSLWNDTEHVREHLRAEGDLELLRRGDDDHVQAGAALVFLDAPILQACTLMDTPGLEERPAGDSDLDLEPLPAGLPADGIIYCDPFNGFLGASSLVRMTVHLRQLAAVDERDPMSRIMIAATHAHDKIIDSQVESAFDRAAQRLKLQLHEELDAAGLDRIRERMFAFHNDSPSRMKTFLDAFESLIGLGGPVSRQRHEGVLNLLEATRAGWLAELERRVDSESRKLEDSRTPMPTPEEFEKQAIGQLKNATDRIAGLGKDSMTHALNTAAGYSPEQIEKLIREHYPKQKDAKQYAAPMVYSRITGAISTDLRGKTQEAAKLLAELVEDWDAKMPNFVAPTSVSADDASRAAGGAFIGGTMGAAGVGALGAYAASFGNLGAYILVAKGVSALSSLGISVGGVAPAVAGVAAIGGPITIAVGIIVASVGIGTLMFRGGWQKALAKNIHKKIVTELLFRPSDGRPERQRSVFVASNPRQTPSIPEAIEQYWREVDGAFQQLTERAVATYREQYEAKDQRSPEEIQTSISRLRAAITWLQRPWALSDSTTPAITN